MQRLLSQASRISKVLVDWGFGFLVNKDILFFYVKSWNGPEIQKCEFKWYSTWYSAETQKWSAETLAAYSRKSFLPEEAWPTSTKWGREKYSTLSTSLLWFKNWNDLVEESFRWVWNREFWNEQGGLQSGCSWQYGINVNLLNRVTLSFRQFLPTGENDSWYCIWRQWSIKLLENSYWL